MTCTTHHNACDCREAALQERIASLQAECDRSFSLANQRALDLASERQRVRVLEEALAPFVDIGPQVGAHGVISKKLGGLAPMTVTVTKVQMQRALNAYNARKPLGEG